MICVQKDDLLVLSNQVKLLVFFFTFLNIHKINFLTVSKRLQVWETVSRFSYMAVMYRIMNDFVLRHLLFNLIFPENVGRMDYLIGILFVIHCYQLDLLIFFRRVIKTLLSSLHYFVVIKYLFFTFFNLDEELTNRHRASLIFLIFNHRDFKHFGAHSMVYFIKAIHFENAEPSRRFLGLVYFFFFD